MLSTLVIVFREVLEAALIISLMLAATRGMLGRIRWTLAGLAAGLIGAGLLALFAEHISNALSGRGQEILNAGILSAAVIMLTWHLVWMRKHSSQISQHIRRVGAAIIAGEQAPTALAVIVGLAILREGSELVLFLYGIATAGSDRATMLLGSLIGAGSGVLIGVVLYFGLLRVPLQQLFRVTGWLIILLAAGLAAQAAGFLVQANIAPALGNQVWDSSFILSQQSVLGQFLHITLGYLDQPMGIQLLAYGLTIIVILILTRFVNPPAPTTTTRTTSKAVAMMVLILSGSLSYPEPAQASHKVYSPRVEAGEIEIEMRSHRSFDNDTSKDAQETTKLEVGYGFTDHWFSSVVSEYEKQPGGAREHSATAWENILQLTEQGEAWVDVGVYLEYEHPTASGGSDALETKLLLEKTLGKFVHTANIIFAREIGSNARNATQVEYAWRTKYLYTPILEPGFEIYGQIGEFGHPLPADQQDHRLGPVLYGEITQSNHSKWKYELGYLVGISTAAPNGTLKVTVEYEFRF